MNLGDIMLSEISQSQKDKYRFIPLTRGTLRSQLMETESRMVVARGWGRGGMGTLFNGYRVSVLQDERVQEISCTTM